LKNEKDQAAADLLSRDPTLSAMLRTTCVATMVDAGHAPNALPQRAKATVNCRILPTATVPDIQSAMERAIANPRVTLKLREPSRPMAVPVPLDRKIIDPAKQLARQMCPSIPVIPVMLTGATDATMLGLINIPTYGVPGLMFDHDGGGAHGLNERIKVQSVYDGRDYLHELLKLYSAR
ncbi:MAG: hypothetical protein RL764_30, partial [Pseudomonadota bacterium]